MAQSEGNTNIESSLDSFTLGRNGVELTELSSINKVNLVKVSLSQNESLYFRNL